MLGRLVDSSYPDEVRRHITLMTVARLWANACYRFAPPFLAVIARDLDVSLDDLGVALAISELVGLLSPFLGRVVDRLPHRVGTAGGLLGVAIGAALAAASSGRWMLALSLVVLNQSKIVFDLGLGSWIADHVPFAKRGRIVGLTETSWALGLLVGVSTLGILTAISSWRMGFAGGALAAAVMCALVTARLGDAAQPVQRVRGDPRPSVTWAGVWKPVLAMFALMAASQCLFVTFGAWLEDELDFGAAALSAVTFLLGGAELAASLSAARQSDRWGKARSAAGGALVMVPAMLILAGWNETAVVGLALLAVTVLSFEFSIVSALPIGTSLVPNAPALGLGLMMGAGTLGRAATSLVATRLYTGSGIRGPMILGAALAAMSAGLFGLVNARRGGFITQARGY